jgi:hypothetical protein
MLKNVEKIEARNKFCARRQVKAPFFIEVASNYEYIFLCEKNGPRKPEMFCQRLIAIIWTRPEPDPNPKIICDTRPGPGPCRPLLHRVQKSQLLEPVLCQFKPVHTLTSSHPHTLFPQYPFLYVSIGFPNGLFKVSDQNRICTSHLPHASYVSSLSQSPWFYYSNNIWRRVHIMKRSKTENDSLLRYCAVQSSINWRTFQRYITPWRWKQYAFLKSWSTSTRLHGATP